MAEVQQSYFMRLNVWYLFDYTKCLSSYVLGSVLGAEEDKAE